MRINLSIRVDGRRSRGLRCKQDLDLPTRGLRALVSGEAALVRGIVLQARGQIAELT